MSLLHDSRPSPPPADSAPKFRPYACSRHTVTRARYITSGDPRGYLPVYEYSLNGQWLMVDADNGYVLWTGIWKALGNAKADIVKMLETQPDLAQQLRRIRGGYLKIQGTWINYEIALRLARRVAWPIRDDLVPIFGPTFPSTCLAPDQPGYGHLSGVAPRRRPRRAPSPPPATAPARYSPPPAPQHPPAFQHHPHPHPHPPYPPAQSHSHAHPAPHAYPYAPAQHASYPAPHHVSSHHHYPAQHHTPAYPSSAQHAYPSSSHSSHHAPSHRAPAPPIHLPPISSLTHGTHTDASAVLRRLRADDDDVLRARPW